MRYSDPPERFLPRTAIRARGTIDTYGKTIPILLTRPGKRGRPKTRRSPRRSAIQYRHPEITPDIDGFAKTVKKYAKRYNYYLGDNPVNLPPPPRSAPEIVFSPREIWGLLNPRKHGNSFTEIGTPGGGRLRMRARGKYIPEHEFYRLLKLLELFEIVKPIARDKNPGRLTSRLYRKDQLHLIARVILWESKKLRERGLLPMHLWRSSRYPRELTRKFSFRLRAKENERARQRATEKNLKKITGTPKMT